MQRTLAVLSALIVSTTIPLATTAPGAFAAAPPAAAASVPTIPLTGLGTVVAQRTAEGEIGSGPTSLDPAALVRAASPSSDGRTAVRAALLQADLLGLAGVGYVVPPDGSQAGFAQPVGAVGVIPIGGGVGPQTVAAGDLDGDGLDDVVTVRLDGAGVTLSALRGTDGSPLWVAPQPAGVIGGFLQVIGDVDGDGRQDLLDAAVELAGGSGSGECSDQGCRDEFVESFRTTTRVIDGGSGTSSWSETIDGFLRQTFTSSADGSSSAFDIEQSNVGVPYHSIGDLDGDGGIDLVSALASTTTSERYAEEGTFPGPVTTTASRSSSGSSEVRLVDGADGRVLRAVQDPADPVIAALPVPDVDGDGVNDVLATRLADGSSVRECTTLLVELSCEESGDGPSAEVAVLGGADLVPAWTTEGLASALLAQAPADLTGDAAVDVLVSQFPFDGDPDVPRLLALDGRSGAQLWAVASEPADPDDPFGGLDTPVVLGATPLQDDGGTDLLAAEPIVDVDPDTGQLDLRAAVLRIDGETGETLLRTEPDVGADEDESVLFVGAQLVRADGDASADVLVQAVAFDDQGGQRTVAVVEDGPRGTVRSQRSTEGIRVLRPLGDVDGDGVDEASLDDLFIGFGTATGSAGGGSAEAGASAGGAAEGPVLAVVELDRDAVLWSVPAPDAGFASIRPAGRLEAADDGIDVVVDTLTVLGDTVQTGVAARSGRDGRLLWSVPEAIDVRRVGGDTRTATAAALSADRWERADAVVIARGDLWPDAVTGAPLATVLDGPLLLAGADQLGPDARAEVQRLGAGHAVLLGGEAALSPAVAAELAALGLSVERVGGEDRFATAAAIARRVVAGGGDGTRVAIARGAHPDPEQGWADAVTAAAYAAANRIPVLLTLPDQLPAPSAAVLTELGAASALVVGGPAAVSGQVEQAVRGLGPSTLRLAGFDRYSTARATAQLVVDEGGVPGTVWLATGRRFPDALAASAAVGTDGVLLLAQGDPADPAEQVLAFLGTNRAVVDQVVLIGGAAAIDPAVEARLRARLG